MNQIQTADYKLQFKQQKDSVRFFFKKYNCILSFLLAQKSIIHTTIMGTKS